MPKVNHVKARKDYPEAGVKKGDMYYTWNLMTGPRSSRTFRQKTPPRRSQLTTSEFLQTIYDIEDELQNADGPDEANDLKDRLETLRDETQEKLDGMPDSLQNGPTGEQLQQRIDGCDSAVNELDSWLSEHEDEWDTRSEQYKADAANDLQAITIDY